MHITSIRQTLLVQTTDCWQHAVWYIWLVTTEKAHAYDRGICAAFSYLTDTADVRAPVAVQVTRRNHVLARMVAGGALKLAASLVRRVLLCANGGRVRSVRIDR